MGWLEDSQKYMNKSNGNPSLAALAEDPAFFRKLKLRFPNVSESKLKESLSDALAQTDSTSDERDVLKSLDHALLD